MDDLLEMQVRFYALRFASNINVKAIKKCRDALEKVAEPSEDFAVSLNCVDEVRHGIETQVAGSKDLGVL